MPPQPPSPPTPPTPPVRRDTIASAAGPGPDAHPPHEQPAPRPATPAPLGAFAHTRFRFTTGLRAGEIAQIRGSSDEVLLTYRSFASIVGTVATLVAAIVAVAGLAGVMLLVAENAPLRAVLALGLTLAFSIVIGLLVPRTNVTLYEGDQPAVTISQRSLFPSAAWVVTAPNGTQLGELRKSMLSRLGRNRWTILQNAHHLGEAREESFGGAVLRKILGKFSRRFETDIVITSAGLDAGRILRRPSAGSGVDVLELTGDVIDRRVVVALATLILGREP